MLAPLQDKPFNTKFVTELRSQVLNPFLARGFKFALTVGGGYLARKYQEVACKNLSSQVMQHRIGVAATFLNATMLHAAIHDLCEDHVVSLDDYSNLFKFVNQQTTLDDKHVLISCGGHREQSSTDMDAVLIAMRLDVNRVISIKNVDGIYDSDPRKNPSAKKLSALSWEQYFDLIGNVSEHKPGDSWPIDPIAARTASDNGMEFIVIGSDLEKLTDVLNGGIGGGTVVK